MKTEISKMGQIQRFDNSGAYIGQDLAPKPHTVIWQAFTAAEILRAQACQDAGRSRPVTVHVFPVKESGRGHAAQFRHYLACILAGRIVRGRYFINDDIEFLDDRETAESLAARRGFHFVEVDSMDYVT